MNVRAKIIGLPRLIQKMKIIPKAAQAEIRIVLAQQATEIVAMMKRLVPVASGDLQESIGWAWGNAVPKGAMAIATAGRGGLTITVFAGSEAAFYSRFVEFGTAKTPAQPFFFPSWRASRKGVKKAVRAAVRNSAKKVAAGG